MDNEILDLLKIMNNKLDEHTQILRTLVYASEIHKAEIDKINHTVARVEGSKIVELFA
ncbi:hypothetical protein KTC96_06670 [Clostridium estertheticum]|uniref:hypothetical protein n=1 Tax=Clostridium estertheticum TaxID=238834 RepID=UPI001C7D2A25|nr:hypothetical protein [Clostridium estertheticum]MBX4261280.1 hypothetical protein [Clostridium estertheticum]WLC71679.1 hypothetical protein KTC96_06670 [Clostridium estertheticum]